MEGFEGEALLVRVFDCGEDFGKGWFEGFEGAPGELEGRGVSWLGRGGGKRGRRGGGTYDFI